LFAAEFPPLANAFISESLSTMPPKRGLGFSFEEVQFLVDSIESILPVGGIQWDAVYV
jgi:hypothetical protein